MSHGPSRVALLLALGLLVSSARGQTITDRASIASSIAKTQNPDGGFGAAGTSTLGATNSAIRILGFVGGSIPDPLKCIAFIRSCQNPESGGFAQTPGGATDVGTTASGLMALGELNATEKPSVDNAIAYLDKHAKAYEEVRIAVAGLEAVKAKPPRPDAWLAIVNEGRHTDGTWGDGPTRAFDTGGRAAAIVRMGLALENRDAILKALREGQQSDGGWASKAGPSDLAATYRVARALYMMGAPPDLVALRGYLARHRRNDGSYRSAPDKDDGGGTYFALIMQRWARLLEGEPPLLETAGFQPLLGSNLDAWDGDKSLWSLEDGVLIGRSPGIDHNTFLAAPGNHRDFALQFQFRLKDGQGNSGVQLRSKRVPPHEMSGYQADIGEGYWGCLYDESRRNRVLAQAEVNARTSVRESRWNHYGIRALGDRITLSLNGRGSVDYRETDAGIAPDGQIAVQIHAGGPMQIEFKDMYIQPVPTPLADNQDTPGWHLRTLDFEGEPRRYSLFLPAGYDPAKKYPVILFLHGAGERGDDGAICAQVGLGPAIVANPDRFPCIAVFPQARRTWAAGSPDAKAALAALDQVMKTYSCDADRVILTGLSMGGMGSWSNAAADPEKFAAVAPICGFESAETALKLKGKPVWSLIGDADGERLLQSTRTMVSALRDAGSDVRYTEYRGVGHNSWDRAYNTPELIAWMLSQKR